MVFLLVMTNVVQAANVLPKANLKVSSARINLGSPVFLDATDSLNPQRQRHGLQYRFKPNQNTRWSNFSSQPIFQYTPTETGKERAYLEVRDTERGSRNITVRDYRVIEPQRRSARIVMLNTAPVSIGEETFFQLVIATQVNTDRLHIRSRWDFEGDGWYDTPFINQQTISHVYSRAGNFRPRVEVLFPDGERIFIRGFAPQQIINNRNRIPTNEYGKLKVNLATINAPVVNISPSYRVYNENTPITFDAQETQTTDYSWIEFQFDGQPTITDQKTITKTFKTPGRHQVITRHCYRRAQPVCAETTTLVEVRQEPTNFQVRFFVQDLTGGTTSNTQQNTQTFQAGKTLRFQASLLNRTPQARRFEYRWDFDGDGRYDTPFSTKNSAEYQYPRAGTFEASVQVKNEFTRADKDLVFNYKILKIQNNDKPIGFFTIGKLQKDTNDDPKTPKLFVGNRVRITPTLKDQNQSRSQLKARFDINNDGRWETDFQTGGGFEWQFLEAGDYRSLMQIQDQNGAIQNVYQTFTVHENPVPQIKITVSKKKLQVGETLALNAQQSIGNQLRYTWNIPENYSPTNTTLSQATANFKTPGQKMIELTITDSHGKTAWAKFPVWVE